LDIFNGNKIDNLGVNGNSDVRRICWGVSRGNGQKFFYCGRLDSAVLVVMIKS